MLKLLIADTSETVVQAISRQCKGLFEIYQCASGIETLKMILKIRPDILLLDLHLPEMSGVDVLRTVRLSGNDLKVIVTGYLQNDAILYELSYLDIEGFFSKPYRTGEVVAQLQDTISKLQSGKQISQSPQRTANHILLSLGFRMGLGRYQNVYQALMLKFEGEDGGITKCLYPKVAKICGGNAAQAEKAIRDAVKDAFNRGNPAVWEMYFPAGRDGKISCPSNDIFLSRMAFALQELFEIVPNQIAQ